LKICGGGPHPLSKWGGVAVVFLVVLAAVWLGLRVLLALGMVIRVPDHKSLARDRVKDRPRPRDAMDGPQDAPCVPQDAPGGPQDAARGDLDEGERSTSARPTPTCDPTFAITAAVWREVIKAVRELAARRRMPSIGVVRDNGPQALAGEPAGAWIAALHETILDRVSRPKAGPACLGGRADTAYLRGWDDAVDWIAQGHDAEAPTWGDVAYMTGWNDAVREVARARRCGQQVTNA
jgi:hypothetical protein